MSPKLSQTCPQLDRNSPNLSQSFPVFSEIEPQAPLLVVPFRQNSPKVSESLQNSPKLAQNSIRNQSLSLSMCEVFSPLSSKWWCLGCSHYLFVYVCDFLTCVEKTGMRVFRVVKVVWSCRWSTVLFAWLFSPLRNFFCNSRKRHFQSLSAWSSHWKWDSVCVFESVYALDVCMQLSFYKNTCKKDYSVSRIYYGRIWWDVKNSS